MNIVQRLEEKITKSHLDDALKHAKAWCNKNLAKHLKGFDGKFDYGLFHYIIDNKQVGPDMWLDQKKKSCIFVSMEKIKWHQERENVIARNNFIIRYGKVGDKPVRITGAVEVDLESMFVHNITESIIYAKPQLYEQCWQNPHYVAYRVENINRTERGLKPWPED